MNNEEHFAETVTRFERPAEQLRLLRAGTGDYLSFDGDQFGISGVVDDHAIWRDVPGGYRHVETGIELERSGNSLVGELGAITVDGEKDFVDAHGPERLPSEYLDHFRAHGWVCLNSVLDPEVVRGLEEVACTDRYADRTFDRTVSPLVQSPALARCAAEPLSLWLIRQYMQIDEIRLAHVPGIAVLDRDDGQRNVQGWHSDFPYLWGISGRENANGVDGRVPTASGATVLGIQRNVCVSDFTKVGGATAFKLGSHVHDSGPPREWGHGTLHYQPGHRAKHGLPYGGDEADIVEAPGGSIILYDARTWHRAGVNRTDNRRAAILQAMTPMYVMPFADTSGAWKELQSSQVFDQLTAREQREVQSLMVHYIAGPAGISAITTDPELSSMLAEQRGGS